MSILGIDPAPASWIKVVGMLPTLPTPPQPELSQAGSLKQTNLVLLNNDTLIYL